MENNLLQDKYKKQINILLDMQKFNSLSDMFEAYEITNPTEQRGLMLLATCGIAKAGRNYIINYRFFEKVGVRKKDIQEYLNKTRRPKVWKNWPSFQLPPLDWDEKIVGEWLADLPADCYYENVAGTHQYRCFATIVYKLYKDTGQLITLERAKSKDVQMAVDPSDYSQEQWDAYDLIIDDIKLMNLADSARGKNLDINFSEPLDI